MSGIPFFLGPIVFFIIIVVLMKTTARSYFTRERVEKIARDHFFPKPPAAGALPKAGEKTEPPTPQGPQKS